MKKSLFYGAVAILIISCKMQPDSDRQYDDETKIYHLQLNPAAGSSYYYDVTNESKIQVEIDGKEVENITRSNAGINYRITRDSANNFLFQMTFDKVRLYTKNGKEESEADAVNAAVSFNPVERMLGILQKASFQVTVSPKGEVSVINGYEEVADQIMAGFAPGDLYARQMAQKQWDKLIGNGIIKKNMDQLFRIFPDSAVHLQDTWRLNTRMEGEIPMNVKSSFKLKSINNETAIITSEGKLTSDKTSAAILGYTGDVVTNLSGDQEGEFEMEANTGMLLNCEIKATIEGTIQVMGREIPVVIKSSVKMKGNRKES